MEKCTKFRKIRNTGINNDQNNHREMESFMQIQNNRNTGNDNSEVLMQSASVALKSIQLNQTSAKKPMYSDKITSFGNFLMASLDEIDDFGIVDDIIFEVNSILYHAKKKIVKN